MNKINRKNSYILGVLLTFCFSAAARVQCDQESDQQCVTSEEIQKLRADIKTVKWYVKMQEQKRKEQEQFEKGKNAVLLKIVGMFGIVAGSGVLLILASLLGMEGMLIVDELKKRGLII